MKWSQAQRFEFIEWRAYWVGRVNRSDLEERFGISTQQTSKDFGSYQEAAPNNIRYDASEKAYLPTEQFQPKFLKLSADRYLRQLNVILNGAISPSSTWFGSPPPAAVTETLTRSVEANSLRMILRAIRETYEVDLIYQSFNNTRKRIIAPHSLAFDGHRWHTRAWCADHEDFRDFVLSRILSVGDSRPSNADSTNDIEWNRFVELRIAPHPKLTSNQKALIEHDFGMTEGYLAMTIRVALSYYFVRRFNLDLDSNQIAPERQQIVLTNLSEIEKAQQSAKSETSARLTRTNQK